MKERLETLVRRLEETAKRERAAAESFQPTSYTHYTLHGRAEAFEEVAAWLREALAETGGKP